MNSLGGTVHRDGVDARDVLDRTEPTLLQRMMMDWRNRIGLYGSYFFGMAAIGFTLPYLPLYLSQKGLSDRTIGLVSTLAALSGLAQFPIGLWSDRIGWRKPFLVVALAVLAWRRSSCGGAQDVVWLGFLVVLFAENGITRAVVESLSGAEAAALAPKGGVGAALGILRFWKPIGIVLMALVGSWMSERFGVASILAADRGPSGLGHRRGPLHPRDGRGEDVGRGRLRRGGQRGRGFAIVRAATSTGWIPKDSGLWVFVVAMILYHAANAPGGVYLGLFLKRDLHAPDRMLAYAFAVSMVAWMLVVWPAGWLADRWGRKPLLVAGWTIMTSRLGAGGAGPKPRVGGGESGARWLGQWPVRRGRSGLDDRPAGRPSTSGRGAGDRRVVPGAGLGDRTGGRPVFWWNRSAISRSVCGSRGSRRRRDLDRRGVRPGDHRPDMSRFPTEGSSTRWPRRPTSQRSP